MMGNDLNDLQMKQVANEKDIEHVLYVIEKNVIPKLGEILAQAKKTNGRVTMNEKDINSLYQKHENCPASKLEVRVKKIEDETEDARFYQKHPGVWKSTLISTGLSALVVIGGFIVILGRIKDLVEPVVIEVIK